MYTILQEVSTPVVPDSDWIISIERLHSYKCICIACLSESWCETFTSSEPGMCIESYLPLCTIQQEIEDLHELVQGSCFDTEYAIK